MFITDGGEVYHLKERYTRIIELVSQYKKIEVSRLAEELHISQVTIRKDLDYLAEKGILKRERGYALLVDPDNINYRMAFAFQRKQLIADAAVELIADGETVMIESGSCCMIFAEQLVHRRKDITIITNSAYLASFIRQYQVSIVLLGGDYQPQAQAMVGPLTKLCASQYQVDKLFVGTDGFSRTLGFTGSNLNRMDTIRSMAKSANQIILLTESEKFTRSGNVSFFPVKAISHIITDSLITDDTKEFLLSQDVRLTLVS